MGNDDVAKCSPIASKKNKLAHMFSKVLFHGGAGITNDGIANVKPEEKKSKDPSENTQDEFQDAVTKEAFFSQIFASIAAVKAAYAQLQFAQSPYDPDGIQSADRKIVAELKNLSELKQSYLKKQFNDPDIETTLLLSELREAKSIQQIFEITIKKLDSDHKLKDSEITFLKEKLAEANGENKLIEKKIYSSGQLAVPDKFQLQDLNQNYIISYIRHTVKSIRSFVRLLVTEMESAGWNLDKAASVVEPGAFFGAPEHRFYAFESFVCKQMFDGFNHPGFEIGRAPDPESHSDHAQFLKEFVELKSMRAVDYLVRGPGSEFAAFCRAKYLRLVHPKMEASFFGDTSLRRLVESGDGIPDSPFFAAFVDMAKRVWLLHCLGRAFDPTVTIFVAGKGSHFSEVYMESVNSDEVAVMMTAEPRVAFAAVPGFRIGKTVVQCQVYLC
ncbi:protein GRAVITROPIC IN THE LIGHT 1-like [Andrographis paniculata]|uniref:protein GRAVITROPIC IN THE LIGHT 1-like n=1 Tax=Andrographis paniculata TaxID=175694 RepID=UPI0021E7FE1E|nr:protein GRAVITROPIC IN THE LIGHT 1-like [Andrographis paniculata]